MGHGGLTGHGLAGHGGRWHGFSGRHGFSGGHGGLGHGFSDGHGGPGTMGIRSSTLSSFSCSSICSLMASRMIFSTPAFTSLISATEGDL
ncbi:MAG TPA: hypothetical protein DDW86_05155 [Clostridiales bacterium]|nr:hypothetical protein [Clostridiales bacterium]